MLVRGIEQRLLPSVIHIAYFILSCPLCTESDKAQCLMGHLVGMQKDTIDAMGCASVAFAARNSSLVSGRYTGEKLLDERVPVLLEAGWRPAPQDGFPDLPQSPRSNGSTGSSAPPAVPQRAAGYVAPHLRGSGVSRPMRQRQLMLRDFSLPLRDPATTRTPCKYGWCC